MSIVVTGLGTAFTQSGSTTTITLSTSVSAGSLIVVAVEEHGNITIGDSLTDTAGNTYVRITFKGNNSSTTNGWTALWYCANCLALVSTNTITYTKANSAQTAVISALYATGINKSSPLDTAVTTTAAGSSTSPSVTSGIPSIAGELFVAVAGYTGLSTDTFTQASGWSAPPTFIGSGGAQKGAVGGGSQVNPGIGTLTYNPTIPTNPWAAIIVGFLPTIPVGNRGYVIG